MSYGMRSDELTAAVERFQRRVFTLARYLLSSREEAEDVAQEVFVRMWQSADAVPPEALEAWLLRVTRNACYDQLRRRRSRRRLLAVAAPGEPERVLSASPDPEVLACSSETGQRLVAALARLDEPQRSVIILREIEGLSCRQIGAIVDMTEGSVRVCLHRARRRLRDQLREVRREPA